MSEMDMGMWDRDYPTEEELLEQESGTYEDVYEEGPPDFDEDLYDDFAEEFEEDNQQSLMDNARVRLEQGRLYEMLIKHDLFDGVDALPQAVANVQKEMKDFIMDRLEILLGMKSEKETVQHITYDSQFNELEIQVLKRVASKMSKGMTDVSEPEPRELNVVREPPKTSGLNSLNGNAKKNRPTPVAKKAQPSRPSQPQRKAQPQRKDQPKRRLKKEMAEVGTGNLGVEDIIKRDMKYIDSLKEMSLEQANDIVSQRHNRPRPKVEINQDIVNAHYSNRMAMNETANTFTALLAAAKKK